MFNPNSYEAQMADYRVARAEFEASPYRRACAALAHSALCAGTLGCCIILPVVGNLTSASYTPTLITVTSAVSCIASACCYDQAAIPAEPEDPDHPRDTSS